MFAVGSAWTQHYAASSGANGTFIKPGGRVAAFVRSTGAQEGDDIFAQSGGLVTSINEGCKRCRSGKPDIVYVLPGHTETVSSSGAAWANLKAGTQIIGASLPGSSLAPSVTLSHTGASLALNVADVSIQGLSILSSTAAVTGGVVITAAGVSLIDCYLAFTGALGANSPVQITGAANVTLARNRIIADSTATMVNITGAGSTNFSILANMLRQTQATSGGAGITVANTAGISGWIGHNLYKSATDGTPASLGVVIGAAAITTVGVFENYAMDGGSGGSGLLSPAVGT